jgi:hypothetical protein
MAEHPDDRVQDILTDTNRQDRLIARQIAYSAAEACSCQLFFGYYKEPSVEFAVCRVAADALYIGTATMGHSESWLSIQPELLFYALPATDRPFLWFAHL